MKRILILIHIIIITSVIYAEENAIYNIANTLLKKSDNQFLPVIYFQNDKEFPQIEYGENNWNIILSKIYDENGNIIREIDSEGNLKEFVYKENMLISIKENGFEILSRVYDRNKLLEEKEISKDKITRIIFKNNLKLVIEDHSKSDFISCDLYDGDEVISLKKVKKNEK